MEKLIMEKCHRPLWFVFIVSFLLSFMFLLFDITTSTGGVGDQNRVTFLVNFVNTIQASKPKSSGYSGSSCNETTSSSFVMRNSTKEEVIVSERPVNSTEDKTKQNFTPSRASAVSNGEPVAEQLKSSLDVCSGRHIYMHDLPSQFNADLVKNCNSLSQWSDMCPYLSNLGLGPRVKDSKRVLPKQGWFATNQFTLEIIFHNRMKHYKCLTNDSSLASAIYVPFYAGLDVGRYLWGFNISMRDASSLSMVKWLAQKPEWKRMWGRDHFLVGGRIAWDFRRNTDDDSDWGSKLMFLPESKNMTLLSIESSSWNNEFAVPYPTSFHPSKKSQVIRWQKKMRRSNRKYLFSFAGAPRRNSAGSIRSELIDQCQSSSTCNFLDCLDGPNKCDNPANLMKAFQSSVFCLQPPGDSYTRRSTFDSILAGCIPVFFHRGSAYGQYLWHLPKNHTKYSVLIPMNDVREKRVLINKTLAGVPKKDVLAMREEVIKLIPRILYTDPRTRQQSFKDAFDIAVEGILKRIETVRIKIKEGKDPSIGFAELNWPKF